MIIPNAAMSLKALYDVHSTRLPVQDQDDKPHSLILPTSIQVEITLPDARVVNQTDSPVNEMCNDKQLGRSTVILSWLRRLAQPVVSER